VQLVQLVLLVLPVLKVQLAALGRQALLVQLV
jgi:hypothetical protein